MQAVKVKWQTGRHPEQLYEGTGSMDQRKYKDVKLIVDNEESLYLPFSDGDEFSFSVRDSIRFRIMASPPAPEHQPFMKAVLSV